MWFSFFVGLFGSLFYGSRAVGEKVERKKTSDLAQRICDVNGWWRDNVVDTEEGRNIIKYKISKMTREEIWEEVKEVYEDIFSKYDLTELEPLNSWCRRFWVEHCYNYEVTRADIIFDMNRAKQIILAKHGLIDGTQGFPSTLHGFTPIKNEGSSCSLLDLLVRKWCTEELKSHNLDIDLRVQETKLRDGSSLYYWCWEIG